MSSGLRDDDRGDDGGGGDAAHPLGRSTANSLSEFLRETESQIEADDDGDDDDENFFSDDGDDDDGDDDVMAEASSAGTTAAIYGGARYDPPAPAPVPVPVPVPAPPPPPPDPAASEKRRAIQAIMRDKTLTDLERRLRIQGLMDGSSAALSDNNNTRNRSANGLGEGGMGRFGIAGGGGGGGPLLGSLAAGFPPSLLAAVGGGGVGGGGNRSHFAAAASVNGQYGGGGMGAGSNSGGGGEAAMACVHYERKCNVVAPCCGGVFGCRVCHDEMSGQSMGCGVAMDRFAIAEVVCKECGMRQGSKTNECGGCGVTFAEYHCPKCNMWMALSKRPFHCDECGFCRVGGRENFRHCARCCMCVSASSHSAHGCMADKYKNACPVCREDMFSSRQPPQDLPCGHAIHAHCFRNLAGFDYRCPICKKTVVSRASMSAAWGARARDIELQPMPPDLARTVTIMCNDCERTSEDLGWHFLGVQCPGCQSFNTVVENMRPGGSGASNDGDEAMGT